MLSPYTLPPKNMHRTTRSKESCGPLHPNTVPACPICNNQDGNEVLQFEEKMFGMGDLFDYVDCDQCKAINIVHAPADLSRFYPEGAYYSMTQSSSVRQTLQHLRDLAYLRDYPGAGLVRRYLPNSAIESTLNACDGDRNSRILDVGCGGGTFLKSLARLGMVHLTGVEPLLERDRKIGPIRLIRGDLSAVIGQFNVITFHHSLEHMPNQKTALLQARQLLAPDGRIVVRIPSRDSLAYQIYRGNWVQIDAPRHRCLHSHRSIGLVAEQAGLKIASLGCDSQSMQFWASEMYRAGLTLGAREQRMFRWRQSRFYRQLAEFANQNNIGDQIVVMMIPA